MPRRPCVHLNGVPLHIVQRGHNHQPCFFGEEYYQAYRYWLGEALRKEQCTLHEVATKSSCLTHLTWLPARISAVRFDETNRHQRC